MDDAMERSGGRGARPGIEGRAVRLAGAVLAAAWMAGCSTTESQAPQPVVSAPVLDVSDPALAGLDASDRQLAAAAQRQALEAGKPGAPVSWRNPANAGRYGSVAAGPVVVQNGLSCRPFTQTVYIDGVPQTSRATACRQADGNWRRSG